MLEKMDKKLAAGIIMNMKSKKAGAICGAHRRAAGRRDRQGDHVRTGQDGARN